MLSAPKEFLKITLGAVWTSFGKKSYIIATDPPKRFLEAFCDISRRQVE
jgi:hypothetical protein